MRTITFAPADTHPGGSGMTYRYFTVVPELLEKEKFHDSPPAPTGSHTTFSWVMMPQQSGTVRHFETTQQVA